MKTLIWMAAILAGMALVAAPGSATGAAEEGDARTGMELTPEADRAVEDGLKYLVKTQGADGSWGGNSYPVAMTSLSMMAFMVKGNFPEQGPYGGPMQKGLDWLLKESKKGGGYMGKSMYEHALATLCLSEVWGMSDRQDIRPALKRAVEIILRSQAKNGGWRYQPQPTDADISVTVMQIVSLASAREAGILVPDATIQKAIQYVKTCEVPSGGFSYQPGGGAGFARTAAGVTSLIMCGERTSPAVKRGLAYLKGLPKRKFESEDHYYYGHYYAIQAMYQSGEADYREWYPQIRDALIAKQKDGHWGGGHNTPMAILILGVPNRFLPIYQR